jgi:hypothetical protein
MECLKSHSTLLPEIGLALLKFVSSHRGLTLVYQSPLVITLTLYSPEIFDEYTRRQYVAKAHERNPFGTEEEPAKFTEFDIFTKVGHNARCGRVDSAHSFDIRFEYFSSSRSGPWATRTVFEREWKNKKTASRQYGYVIRLDAY